MIDELGHWVLQQVCAQLAQWQAADYRISISVNVSGRQLRSGRLVQQVQQALDAAGVSAARLELEVTEGTLIDDIEAASEQLAQIKRTGVILALDDFGTGYSSLRHLQQLPGPAASCIPSSPWPMPWARPWWPKAWRTRVRPSCCASGIASRPKATSTACR